MNEVLLLTVVAIVIFVTHFQQGITGFGCTVLALPFITLLLDIDIAVKMLVITGWVVALTIVVQSWRQIVWREFLWVAIPVGIAMPFGVWVSRSLPKGQLKLALGVFVLLVGIHGLLKQLRQAQQTQQPAQVSSRSRWLASLFLPAGGILHGAFGSGGPLVIVYATRVIPEKTLFRVTLCLLWTALNTILIGQWILNGAITPQIWKLTAFGAPIGFLGVILGNRAHHRTNVALFRKVVYCVLIASGIVLGSPSLSAVFKKNAPAPNSNPQNTQTTNLPSR